MKKLILLFIFCLPILSTAQDKFNESIIQLGNDFGYFPKSKNENFHHKSLIADSFKKSKEYCAEYDSKLSEIDFNEFVSAKSTEVVSKRPLKGKIYLRVTIEEWTFVSKKSAKEFESKFKLVSLDCLNKGGIEFWRVNEKIYLIVSPATMFSYEFKKIKKSMNKKLS